MPKLFQMAIVRCGLCLGPIQGRQALAQGWQGPLMGRQALCRGFQEFMSVASALICLCITWLPQVLLIISHFQNHSLQTLC